MAEIGGEGKKRKEQPQNCIYQGLGDNSRAFNWWHHIYENSNNDILVFCDVHPNSDNVRF